VTRSISKRLIGGGLAVMLLAGACSGGSPSPSAGSAAPATGSPGGGGPAGGAPDCLSFADIYAIIGPESSGFDNWSDAAGIASELGSSTQFPDLALSITAPGEESGTFDSFVELVIDGPAEERGIAEEERTTRPDYQSNSNDNAIIDGIATAAGSFGWVGFAFYEENLDRVRAFKVAEEADGACVEPTAETIASNEYPIARDLFIYVNKAKATENPAVVAYVDHYMAAGTIDSVLETVPYVPLAADALTESQTAWTSGKGSMTASPDGTIAVTGSSTVEPISSGVAEAFKAQNPGFNYTVEGPGTGDGFAKFCAGEADITDASRAIRDEEKALCERAGIQFIELKVAIDGLTVMTQK
jgi:ABC-type phosphate transport system substrate-binding protein